MMRATAETSDESQSVVAQDLAVLFRSEVQGDPGDATATARLMLSLRSGERLRDGRIRMVAAPSPRSPGQVPTRFNADGNLSDFLARPGHAGELLFVAPYRDLSVVVLSHAHRALVEAARDVLPEERIRITERERPLAPRGLAVQVGRREEFERVFGGLAGRFLYPPITFLLFSGEPRRAALPRRWGRHQFSLRLEDRFLGRALAGLPLDPKRLVGIAWSDPSRNHDVPDLVYEVPSGAAGRVAARLRERLEAGGYRFFEREEAEQGAWIWQGELLDD